MKNYRTIFTAPTVCAALLVGMTAERWTWVTPVSAESYHTRAKAAVESIPTRIGSWLAVPEPIPREALALLRPNVIQCWRYLDTDQSNPRRYDRWAILLVDQCKDARDMNGHWPPNCYVNSGQEKLEATPREWTVGDLTIKGTEYLFRQTTVTESSRTAVYNFLIVPGERETLRDMDGVTRAAENFQQRFYGAAQFQVVMNADLPRSERNEIFQTLMKPCVPVIRTLMSRGIQ
jgi:hypothetical protein